MKNNELKNIAEKHFQSIMEGANCMIDSDKNNIIYYYINNKVFFIHDNLLNKLVINKNEQWYFFQTMFNLTDDDTIELLNEFMSDYCDNSYNNKNIFII
jgi:hypothetical protein